jgi:hypothetical protein
MFVPDRVTVRGRNFRLPVTLLLPVEKATNDSCWNFQSVDCGGLWSVLAMFQTPKLNNKSQSTFLLSEQYSERLQKAANLYR